MSLLFIDANVWLDFYTGSKQYVTLLSELDSAKADLFISAQVVEEVQRNKATIAARAIADFDKSLQSARFTPLPFHLAEVGADRDNAQKLYDQMVKSIAACGASSKQLSETIVRKVGSSTDPISLKLSELWKGNVRNANPEVMNRARQRRELGKPPGKPSDPLGDQLTWEILLETYDGKQPLWIITRDSDYYTKSGDQLILNSALYADLAAKSGRTPVVRVFDSLGSGLKDYIESTPEREGYRRQIEEQRLQLIRQEEADAAEARRRREKAAGDLAVGVGLAALLGLAVAGLSGVSVDDND